MNDSHLRPIPKNKFFVLGILVWLCLGGIVQAQELDLPDTLRLGAYNHFNEVIEDFWAGPTEYFAAYDVWLRIGNSGGATVHIINVEAEADACHGLRARPREQAQRKNARRLIRIPPGAEGRISLLIESRCETHGNMSGILSIHYTIDGEPEIFTKTVPYTVTITNKAPAFIVVRKSLLSTSCDRISTNGEISVPTKITVFVPEGYTTLYIDSTIFGPLYNQIIQEFFVRCGNDYGEPVEPEITLEGKSCAWFSLTVRAKTGQRTVIPIRFIAQTADVDFLMRDSIVIDFAGPEDLILTAQDKPMESKVFETVEQQPISVRNCSAGQALHLDSISVSNGLHADSYSFELAQNKEFPLFLAQDSSVSAITPVLTGHESGHKRGYFILHLRKDGGETFKRYIYAEALVDVKSAVPSTVRRHRVKAYPNPAKNVVQIIIPFDEFGGKARCSLFNGLGQMLKEIRQTGSSTTLTVADLPPGIYYLRVGNAVEFTTLPISICR